ncbi:MAG: 4Fe-4S dicluster domain-containing protein [Candidatus Hermodarchaeota archaeon]
MLKKSKGLKSRFIDLTKFDIEHIEGSSAEKIKKVIPKVFKTVRKAISEYKKELEDLPEIILSAPKEFWEEFEEYAKSIGIDLLGYAPIDEHLIFEKDHVGGLEVLYQYAIVLGMEMDYEAIDSAPEPSAGAESLRIYAELGDATNKLTNFIRSKGFRAIACHPLGGPILYPAMAVKAGLGRIGTQGLLVTKKFGPRQRLSLIAVNINNIPRIPREEFEIENYCKKCKRCVLMCPVGAIYDEVIHNNDGTTTRIDGEKCIRYFYETTGCSVCIKECPFHKIGYKAMYYSRL